MGASDSWEPVAVPGRNGPVAVHGAASDEHPDAQGAEDRTSPPTRRTRGRVAVVVLSAGATIAAAGWVLLSESGIAGSSLGDPSPAGVESTQPVTEFAPQDRSAPVELSGTTLTGEHLDVARLRGQPVVLNVWGSWCAPCRAEAPVLRKTSAAYAGQVSFVGIDVKDNAAAALAFEESYGITYPSIEDPTGQAVLALSQHVPASAVPVTLVLDDEGRVAARILGATQEPTLTALLDSVLAEAA